LVGLKIEGRLKWKLAKECVGWMDEKRSGWKDGRIKESYTRPLSLQGDEAINSILRRAWNMGQKNDGVESCPVRGRPVISNILGRFDFSLVTGEEQVRSQLDWACHYLEKFCLLGFHVLYFGAAIF